MKLTTRFGCLALSGAVLFGLAAPVYADAAVTKEETVYVTLAADGSPQKTTVSVQLHSKNGLSGVVDQSNLQNISDVKGDLVPTLDGNGLHWDTSDQDVYYQGDSSASLPISVSITYAMDGQEMSAEEITGKTGHLSMTIRATNNRYTVQQVGGATRTIYKPYLCAVGTIMSEDDFKNIDSDNGTIQSDSSKSLAAFVLTPGMAQTFDGLLTGKFSDLSDKLLDSVTLEADVENLELPPLYIACASTAEDLLDLESDDEDDESVDDLFDDLDELRDATQDLLDGTSELYDGTNDLYDAVFGDLTDGANELKDGTVELRDGTSELKDGADELDDGATKLDDGASDLQDGAGKLDTGASNLKNGAGKLNTGAGSLFTGATRLGAGTTKLYQGLQLLNTKLTQLDSFSAGLTTGGKTIVTSLLAGVTSQVNGQLTDLGLDYTIEDLTLENYSTVLNGLPAILQGKVAEAVTAKVRVGVKANVTKTARADIETAIIQQAAVDWRENKSTAETALTGADLDAAADAALEAQAATIDAKVDYLMANPTPEIQAQLSGALQQAQAKLGTLSEKIADIVAQLDQVKTFAEGLPTYTAGVHSAVLSTGADSELQKGAGLLDTSVNGKDGLLEGTKTLKQGTGDLVDGANTLKNGTGDLVDATNTLKDGTNTLKDGTTDLVDGVKKLDDGAVELDDGANELKDGVNDLRDGATDLRDGAKELDDGMNEYNDDGISKLTDSEDIDQLHDLYDVLDAVRDMAEKPSDFSGTPAGADVSTKFIMRTEVPSLPDAEPEVEEAPEATGFWHNFVTRFKHLFGK